MKDARGEVLYVGKAQSLRSRVRSYWQKQAPSARSGYHQIREVIDRVADLEVTEVDSVSEALLLEAQPDQAVQAAVQRPAQGRQELPVHQGHAGRRLPAHRADPEAAQRRQPLLRAVRVRASRRRGDEPRPPAVPVPDLHDRHQGRRAGPPAAVPPVPHQALPGPVHRGHLEGRPTAADIAQVELFLEGNARTPWSRACSDEMARRLRAAAVREGGGRPRQDPGDRADDGEPEDGRVRAHGARPRRRSPARTTRRRSSCSSSATARCSGRDVFFLDAPARRARRRGPGALPARSTTPARRASRARCCVPRSRDRDGGPRDVPGRAAGERRPPADPAARREARS